MITVNGSGVSGAQVIFTAPVDGLYWQVTKTVIGDVEGPTPPLHTLGAMLNVEVSASAANGSASPQVLVSDHRALFDLNPGGMTAGTLEANQTNWLQKGCELSLSTSAANGLTNSPDWELSIRVHLLGGPDLAMP